MASPRRFRCLATLYYFFGLLTHTDYSPTKLTIPGFRFAEQCY
jgi:hypothetical protein